jgi:hypothetical protein
MDPLAEAEFIVRAASDRLAALLQTMAAGLADRYPLFPGSLTRLIEVDPDPSPPPQKGLIGVCPDGELREFDIRLPDDPALGDREDRLMEIGDLPFSQLIPLQIAAIQALAREIRRPR